MIKIISLKKSFQDKVVLRDLSMTIEEGERVALMGESGVGKTTLLRIIAGLETPDSGVVKGRPDRIAYVFQESRLFEHLTALDNVATVSDLPLKSARLRAKECLDLVMLEDSYHLYPRELSGGMAQRVAIARALMPDADLILLDEPFSALDGPTKTEIATRLDEYFQNKTVIMVTHNTADASLLGARIIHLN